jgi:hypothetical protein
MRSGSIVCELGVIKGVVLRRAGSALFDMNSPIDNQDLNLPSMPRMEIVANTTPIPVA